MKIYVAGPLAAATTVIQYQQQLVEAGHSLTLDWTTDLSFTDNFSAHADASRALATEEITAVLAADALIVVAGEHDGRGMFVELGAALAAADAGTMRAIVVVGRIEHESVFYFHPAVDRVETIDQALSVLATLR